MRNEAETRAELIDPDEHARCRAAAKGLKRELSMRRHAARLEEVLEVAAVTLLAREASAAVTQHLERNAPAQQLVVGGVDRSIRARADLPLDRQVAERIPRFEAHAIV